MHRPPCLLLFSRFPCFPVEVIECNFVTETQKIALSGLLPAVRSVNSRITLGKESKFVASPPESKLLELGFKLTSRTSQTSSAHSEQNSQNHSDAMRIRVRALRVPFWSPIFSGVGHVGRCRQTCGAQTASQALFQGELLNLETLCSTRLGHSGLG